MLKMSLWIKGQDGLRHHKDQRHYGYEIKCGVQLRLPFLLCAILVSAEATQITGVPENDSSSVASCLKNKEKE
jgi:hypothetical protein